MPILKMKEPRQTGIIMKKPPHNNLTNTPTQRMDFCKKRPNNMKNPCDRDSLVPISHNPFNIEQCQYNDQDKKNEKKTMTSSHADDFYSCKAEAFCPHSNSGQQRCSQLLVWLVFRQVDLIETGVTLRETSFWTKISDNCKFSCACQSVFILWTLGVPCIPSSALNPFRGTLDVPVANWRSFALSSLVKARTARQNHWIWGDEAS